MSASKLSKDIILERLGKLEALMNDVYGDNDEFLFMPHQIEVLSVIEQVEMGNSLDAATLQKMNQLWRETKAVEKHGSIEAYEKEIWSEVDELLIKGRISAAAVLYKQKRQISSISSAKEDVKIRYLQLKQEGKIESKQ